MEKYYMPVKSVMDAIVPITRFNRGEANKIFDEVKKNGFKIVLKNNVPACVLIRPEQYEAMAEALEDYALYFEAENRMNVAENQGLINAEDVYSRLQINDSDLDDVDVEIEA